MNRIERRRIDRSCEKKIWEKDCKVRKRKLLKSKQAIEVLRGAAVVSISSLPLFPLENTRVKFLTVLSPSLFAFRMQQMHNLTSAFVSSTRALALRPSSTHLAPWRTSQSCDSSPNRNAVLAASHEGEGWMGLTLDHWFALWWRWASFNTTLTSQY